MDKQKLIELMNIAQDRQIKCGKVFAEDYQAILDLLGIDKKISKHDNPLHVGAVIQLEICKLMLRED